MDSFRAASQQSPESLSPCLKIGDLLNFLCLFAVALSFCDGCCKLIFIALLLLSHLQSSTDCVLEILLFNASHSFCFLSLGLDADLPSHLESLFSVCLALFGCGLLGTDHLLLNCCLRRLVVCWHASSLMPCTLLLHFCCDLVFRQAWDPLVICFCFQSVLEVNALLLHSWGWLWFGKWFIALRPNCLPLHWCGSLHFLLFDWVLLLLLS